MISTTKGRDTNVGTLGVTSGEGVHPPSHSDANGSQLQFARASAESDEPQNEKDTPVRVEDCHSNQSWNDMTDEKVMDEKEVEETQQNNEKGKQETKINHQSEDFFENNMENSQLVTMEDSTQIFLSPIGLSQGSTGKTPRETQSTQESNPASQESNPLDTRTQATQMSNGSRTATSQNNNRAGGKNKRKYKPASAIVYNQLFGGGNWARYLKVNPFTPGV